MPENKPVLEIKNLTKQIGKRSLIRDVSFDIYPGEIFGFLGPNGAGKTTTIRMIVGLISITKGDILIKGVSIQKDFARAISEVGGIVENPEMYSFLSGYQNLVHYARMVRGVGRDRIDKVVELVGLGNRIHDKVKTYSLGMRQRLGLAQALLHSPSLLILDEPTNGLDPAGIREIRDYLRKLTREEGIAVMVSSHLLSEMELMCDRIGIIQNGELIDLQSVQRFVQDESLLSVRLSVDPIEEARQCLLEQQPSLTPTIHGNELEVTIEKEQIPTLTRLLVEHNISIYSIYPSTKSLEDRFLEVTGGKEIV